MQGAGPLHARVFVPRRSHNAPLCQFSRPAKVPAQCAASSVREATARALCAFALSRQGARLRSGNGMARPPRLPARLRSCGVRYWLRAGALRWRAASAADPPGRAQCVPGSRPRARRAGRRAASLAGLWFWTSSYPVTQKHAAFRPPEGMCTRGTGDHLHAALRAAATAALRAPLHADNARHPGAQIRRAVVLPPFSRPVRHGHPRTRTPLLMRHTFLKSRRTAGGGRPPGTGNGPTRPRRLSPPLRCGGNRRKASGVASGPNHPQRT